MIEPTEVFRFALLDFGEPATVNGDGALTVIPVLEVGGTELKGEMIEHSHPYALAAAVDVANLDIVAGVDGNTLTLRGLEYTVVAIEPDGLGCVALTLEPR